MHAFISASSGGCRVEVVRDRPGVQHPIEAKLRAHGEVIDALVGDLAVRMPMVELRKVYGDLSVMSDLHLGADTDGSTGLLWESPEDYFVQLSPDPTVLQ